MRFEGSVAVVTGGVSGLGLGATQRMVRHGASVVMLDINEKLGREATKQLGDFRWLYSRVGAFYTPKSSYTTRHALGMR